MSSLPYFLSYFLQTLYGLADLFIIGQFCGVEATTAVTVGSQIMHMLTVMIVGLAMGATVMIGRSVGANDKKACAKYIGNTATLFMLISICATAVLLILTKVILRAVNTPGEAFSQAQSYLTICFIGVPFITAYNIISAIFRGLGDSKSPMYFIAISCAANIALDYLFIGALKPLLLTEINTFFSSGNRRRADKSAVIRHTRDTDDITLICLIQKVHFTYE